MTGLSAGLLVLLHDVSRWRYSREEVVQRVGEQSEAQDKRWQGNQSLLEIDERERRSEPHPVPPVSDLPREECEAEEDPLDESPGVGCPVYKTDKREQHLSGREGSDRREEGE
jgi:hypothetical protein